MQPRAAGEGGAGVQGQETGRAAGGRGVLSGGGHLAGRAQHLHEELEQQGGPESAYCNCGPI